MEQHEDKDIGDQKSPIARIADAIESGNLRVTSRNNRSMGHPQDLARMVQSAALSAASNLQSLPAELEAELISRGWKQQDAVEITRWFAAEQQRIEDASESR